MGQRNHLFGLFIFNFKTTPLKDNSLRHYTGKCAAFLSFSCKHISSTLRFIRLSSMELIIFNIKSTHNLSQQYSTEGSIIPPST